MTKKHKTVGYFVRTLAIVIGLVLIWRGIWHILDYLDGAVFAGQKLWTAVGGIIVGLFVLIFLIMI